MSVITFNIKKASTPEAKQILIKALVDMKVLTTKEWEVLFSLGVCRRPRKTTHKR